MKQTYLLFAALLTLVLPWGQLQAAFLEWDATAGSEQTTYHERELFTDAPWKLLTLQHLFYHNQGTLALLNYSITAGQGEDRVIAAPRQGQAYADYRWGTAKGSWSMFSANSKVTFTAQSPTTLETSGSYQALADPYEGAARVGAALQLEANGSFVEFSRLPQTQFELLGSKTAGLRHYQQTRIMVGWHWDRYTSSWNSTGCYAVRSSILRPISRATWDFAISFLKTLNIDHDPQGQPGIPSPIRSPSSSAYWTYPVE